MLVTVMVRETWTDERLDDLKGEMNVRFDQVDQRFDRVEAEIKGGRGELKGEIKELGHEIKGEIKELRDDIKSMQRLMIHGFIGVCTLMLTGFGFIGFQ
jgi:hypothetical protein